MADNGLDAGRPTVGIPQWVTFLPSVTKMSPSAVTSTMACAVSTVGKLAMMAEPMLYWPCAPQAQSP